LTKDDKYTAAGSFNYAHPYAASACELEGILHGKEQIHVDVFAGSVFISDELTIRFS
jgi:hypothetical protein